jgi:hypothetical protein
MTPPPAHHPEPWAVLISPEDREKILERAFELHRGYQFPGSDAHAETPAGKDEREVRQRAWNLWAWTNRPVVEAALKAVEEIIPALERQ